MRRRSRQARFITITVILAISVARHSGTSRWHKQARENDDLLRSDLRQHIEDAKTDHERYFFQLAKAASDRLDV